MEKYEYETEMQEMDCTAMEDKVFILKDGEAVRLEAKKDAADD